MSVDSDNAMIIRTENLGICTDQKLTAQPPASMPHSLLGIAILGTEMQVQNDRVIPFKTIGPVWEHEARHYKPIQTRIDLEKDLYFPSAITLYDNLWRWTKHD